ncbi:MAG TPA: YdeI/OmpD-associated family protein [Candidatus Thermoplasmatota archaeon]|nr:YdeI/OmpD-associated family protein [Candidatus Thermoplasmatota archaeon]
MPRGAKAKVPAKRAIPAADLLDVGADRRKWRAWLRRNHAKRTQVWLVYWRAASGRPRIAYNAAVEEALCYGWIDSQQKGVDEDRVAQRFTPRRPGSGLSEMNRQRVRNLVASGKMTKAGLEAIAGSFDPGKPEPPVPMAADVRAALRAAPAAWRNFQAFPAGYRRLRLAYVEAGRRHGPEQVAKRIRNLVAKSAAGKRFGAVKEMR